MRDKNRRSWRSSSGAADPGAGNADANTAGQPSVPEGLADFWLGLAGDGCDLRHLQKMLDCIQAERAATMQRAAKLYYKDGEDAPLSTQALAEEIDRMRARLAALELAIAGAGKDLRHEHLDGLAIVARDLAESLERFENAFVTKFLL